MYGLTFEEARAVAASAPNRVDVACFVGFVGRRPAAPPSSGFTPVPSGVGDWLRQQGWIAPDGAVPSDVDLTTADLTNVPVPIESWDVFDGLFAWDARPLDRNGTVGPTYLGAAIRSFFAQGGRRCYVVRVGDPWLPSDGRAERLVRLSDLIPGFPYGLTSSPVDRSSWRGVGVLAGLPDVSFLCLPDVVEAVGVDRVPLSLPDPIPPGPEIFVECSAPLPPTPDDQRFRLYRAPRCDDAGFQDWAQALRVVADDVKRDAPEVQLVAAVPLPLEGSTADRDLLGYLSNDDDWPAEVPAPLANAQQNGLSGLASAFVQLAYPWVRTPGSVDLPEQLESPDAVLVGLLARNALGRGTYRAAASLDLADVYDLFPIVGRDQLLGSSASQNGSGGLIERLSVFGPTPAGLRLLSDVTTSLQESYRPANVNRLVSTIRRAARQIGEDVVFEVSGEALWGRLRDGLGTLLLDLYRAGALRGARPADAFDVRCDRSTMTQNDLDNGRVIARVQFDAAMPIERITVVLAMDNGGQISLAPTSTGNEEAA